MLSVFMPSVRVAGRRLFCIKFILPVRKEKEAKTLQTFYKTQKYLKTHENRAPVARRKLRKEKLPNGNCTK